MKNLLLVRAILKNKNKTNEQKLNELDVIFSEYDRKLDAFDPTDEWSNPNNYKLSIWYYQKGSALNTPNNLKTISLSNLI